MASCSFLSDVAASCASLSAASSAAGSSAGSSADLVGCFGVLYRNAASRASFSAASSAASSSAISSANLVAVGAPPPSAPASSSALANCVPLSLGPLDAAPPPPPPREMLCNGASHRGLCASPAGAVLGPSGSGSESRAAAPPRSRRGPSARPPRRDSAADSCPLPGDSVFISRLAIFEGRISGFAVPDAEGESPLPPLLSDPAAGAA